MNTYILFLSLMISAGHATPPTADKCDFESLTNACKLFDPPGNKIALSDGTFIPKIGVLANEASHKSVKQDLSGIDQSNAAVVDGNLKLLSILNEIPPRQLNDKTKFVLSNNAMLVVGIWDENFEKFKDNWPPLILPWPPGDNDPKVQKVDISTIRNELLKRTTPAQRERMNEIAGQMQKINFQDAETQAQTPQHSLTREMTTIKDSRRKRTEELVDFVRGSMVKNIVGNRPENEWAPDERAAIEKIKAIKYRAGDDANVKNSPLCQGLMPNAFYDPATNSINLCTSFYNYPDSTIVTVLGHEMGHSVDPCGCQTHAHHINTKKVEDLWAAGQLPSKMEADEDLNSMATALGQMSFNGATTTAYPFEHFLNDPKKVSFFIDAGILTPLPGQVKRVTQDGNSLDGYFLNDVYRCILDNTNGSFRQTTLAEVQDAADIVVNNRQAIAGAKFNPKREKERIVRAFTRYPQCFSPRANTQMREVISDWFGAKALGDFLSDKKMVSVNDRLSPVAFFAGTICTERSSLKNSSKSVAGEVLSTRTSLRAEAGSHPSSIMRVEKVILADSRVRKALGCSSDTIPSTCNHNTGASAANPTQSGTGR